jgi:hypothetical protein
MVNVAEKFAQEVEENDPFIHRLFMHELLMWLVSKEVSEYWSHVTEENRVHHPGSDEDTSVGLCNGYRGGNPRDVSDSGVAVRSRLAMSPMSRRRVKVWSRS